MSWAGWVFDFYDLILYTFLLIPIGQELHLDNVQLSYALGTSLAATAVGGVLFGILSDRYGRKSILQWTILCYSVGAFLCGTAQNVSMLIVFRILTGMGVGGKWATGQTYVGETFPPRVRGRYGAYMQTGAPVGIAIASVVGGFIAPLIGWRNAFFLSVLPALLVVFIGKHLPESDIWLEHRRMSRAIGGAAVPDETWGKFIELFRGTYRKLFLLSLVLAVFDMSVYWFTYSWLPGYLYQQRQFSISKSAVWMLVTQCGGFIGYATFGFVADRFGRRPAYSIYSFVMALGLMMVTLLWDVIAAYPGVILIFMSRRIWDWNVWRIRSALFGAFSYNDPEHCDGICVQPGTRSSILHSCRNRSYRPIIRTRRRHLNCRPVRAFDWLLIWTLPETKGRAVTI